MTPLMAAIRGGHLEEVQLLLDNGADANFPAPGNTLYSDRGATLQFAALNGSYAIAQLLLKRSANVNSLRKERTIYGRRALETAAMYGGLDIVHFFLKKGANTNFFAKNNYVIGRAHF